jgi:Cysteine-rich secretory protein family
MSGVLIAIALATAAPARPAPTLSFNARLLAAHNGERQRVGMPALLWSDRLSADAKAWADHLARTATFDHAPDQPGKEPQGENLWMGTAKAYSPEDMVGSWIEERALFRPGLFPKISSTGNWQDVGHYTQLIWFSTTQVGCALSANREDEYLVCRYGPPGNWIGQSPIGPPKAKIRMRR